MNKDKFVLNRTFDAPIDLMWKMWTEPEHMKNWIGPQGVKTGYQKMDFRVGGRNHYSMLTPDGGEVWGMQVFREIKKPTKLVYIQSFSDKDGGLTTHPMAPTWPKEMLTEVTFTEQGKKTLITLEWLPINSSDPEWATFDNARAGMNEGWGGSFEQLDAYLETLSK